MKKGIVAAVIATMLTTATLACPTMPTYCTCGMCGTGYQAQQTIQQTACYDRTGEGYYDASGHYCEYGGYWDGGCWIQTVGYWEGGEWYWSRRADGTLNKADDKAGFWKCPYHNSRMCLEIIERNA